MDPRGWPPLLIWMVVGGAAVLLWQARPGTGAIEGNAHVVDGDSLVVAGREIRLDGIDAPEGRQQCMRNATAWPCGEEARRHLMRAVGSQPVTCRSGQTDQYGRHLAVCEVAGRSLNAEMVEAGWAVAYGDYASEEREARAAKRGLWSGEFERPRDWRARNRPE